jgi:hypothetical protein
MYEASRRLLGERYDRVAYLDGEAYELDITDTWRAIVCVRNSKLTLYRVGDHNMILRRRFTRTDFEHANREPLLSFTQIVCDSILSAARSPNAVQLVDALDARWLYTLSRQQAAAAEALFGVLADDSLPARRVLVSGGPGTGKTSILLQVADVLDWNPNDVALDVSDRVAEYLASGLESRVLRCRRRPLELTEQRVLLVDDPRRWRDVESAYAIAGFRAVRLAVVATDLAQVEQVVGDRELRIFLGGRNIQHIQLAECYRQTENVGQTSIAFLRHISERFTKHIHQENIEKFARSHRLSVESANEMTFVSPGGYTRIYEEAESAHLLRELARVRSQPQWTHWHPVCVVLESPLVLHRLLKREIEALRGVVVDIEDTEAVRGVEYQHVFLVLSRDTLRQVMVTGRSGLSTDDYLRARNMRVPFSRATDSLVVFGFDATL